MHMKKTVKKITARSLERSLQIKVASTIDDRIKAGCIWTAFPAGGGGKIRGVFLKRMGLKRGWADLQFIFAGNFFAIELKAGSGRLSREQRHVQSAIREQGFFYESARSVDEVVSLLETWGLLK